MLDHQYTCQFSDQIDDDQAADSTQQDQVHQIVLDDQVDVFIAAMVGRVDKGADGGWVSIINLSNDAIRLDGWTLSDPAAARRLSGEIAPGEAVRVQPPVPSGFNEAGGTVELHDAMGRRIDRVRYGARAATKRGNPNAFTLMEAAGLV